MQKLKYKFNYWKRKILLALGVCPKCWSQVNYTPKGRAICPNCGQ
jgi:predicted amidophosphoribosyltransferase